MFFVCILELFKLRVLVSGLICSLLNFLNMDSVLVFFYVLVSMYIKFFIVSFFTIFFDRFCVVFGVTIRDNFLKKFFFVVVFGRL